MHTEIVPSFDYGFLDPDVRANVQAATRRLHELERRTSESIIEIGRHLIAVKAEIGHGNFLPWIEAEFGWSRVTAHRFMNVAEEFGDKSNTVKHLGAKVLYALAAPSTPNDVRIEFTDLAAIGNRVTHQDVQHAIAERRKSALERPEPDPESGDDWDEDDYPEVPGEILNMETGEVLAASALRALPPAQATPEDRAVRAARAIVEEYVRDMALRISAAIPRCVKEIGDVA